MKVLSILGVLFLGISAQSATPFYRQTPLFLRGTTLTPTLLWNDNDPVEGVTGYNVYEVAPRNGSSAPFWRRIGTTFSPTFTTVPLAPGSFHIFAIRAVNVVGEGQFSNVSAYRAP